MATESTLAGTVDEIAVPPVATAKTDAPKMNVSAAGGLQVIRRNGKVTAFDPNKIAVAMTKAFLAVEGGNAAASSRIHNTVAQLTRDVTEALKRRNTETVHIEDVQDQVELMLMRAGEHKVARDYVLYRERQAQKRAEEAAASGAVEEQHIVNVTAADGSTRPLDVARLRALVDEACAGLDGTDAEAIMADTCRNLFDGVKEKDVSQTLVMSARTLIEKEPNYSQASARLLLDVLRREALSFLGLSTAVKTQEEMGQHYTDYLKAYLKKAAELELVDPRLCQYDLERLGAALKPERDL